MTQAAQFTGYLVGAKGNTGRGIRTISQNSDYTIKIILTDGTIFTTSPIPGFTSVDLDENFDLVVTKTDGTEITVETGLGEYNTTLSGYKTDAENAATSAGNSKDAASGSATTATQQATLARSYAKGDTSSRTGEATDNAEYFKGQASESATSASSSASTAEAQALVSEGYAQGTQASTPVTSDSPYYHNNSKYFSELASASDTSAASSASSANTDALKAEGYAVGKQNGTTQTSGTYYHNNAQYYNSQATQAASISATQATASGTQALKSEGFAVGEQSGTPVTSGSDYYENNAKYYAGEAADSATAAAASAASIDPENMAGVIAYNKSATYPADTVGKALQNIGDSSAPAIIETATGSIASFTDGANVPVKDLVAEIVPLQSGSGDPSPSNVRAISGWTGCNISVRGINIWDEEWEVGTIYSNGTMYNDPNCIRSKNYNSCVGGATYYLHCGSANNVYFVRPIFYDADKNRTSDIAEWCANTTITAPADACYFKLTTQSAEGSVYGGTYKNDISINYPSTDHDYHAYNGETHTISFASAGTVYGGRLDVTSGVLTVDWVRETMQNRGWTLTDGVWVGNASGDWKAGASGYDVASDFMCDIYKNGSLKAVKEDGTATLAYRGTKLYIKDTNYSDATQFNNSLSGHYFCVKLATPQTYQLTPTEVKTLLKNNNIWADTGDVTVEYVADTKTFIENLVNA